ncbi:MAG: DUF5320 domain-containing protein [Candidatus Kapaibacterium sp.]
MPRFDGTGPNGAGAKTGRKLGSCEVEQDSKKVKNAVVKQNVVRGMGLRRGQNR